jgi:putative membrane protein
MMMRKIIFVIILCLGGIAAIAQIPQPDPDTTAKHFLIVASIGNLQEVSAGQLAVEKGKRAEVQSFGQMMVKDHGQAEQQLLQLAKGRGIQLPMAATGGIHPDLNLKNAGVNFDKLYIHAMVSAHNNTVQTFENYATTGKDPVIRAFAKQQLPILKHHLAEVKNIDTQLKSIANSNVKLNKNKH